jgi:hypothetical protein
MCNASDVLQQNMIYISNYIYVSNIFIIHFLNYDDEETQCTVLRVSIAVSLIIIARISETFNLTRSRIQRNSCDQCNYDPSRTVQYFRSNRT